MPPEHPEKPVKYIRDNWFSLLISITTSFAMAVFAIGAKTATLESQIAQNKNAIESISKMEPEKVRWMAEQHEATIILMRSEARGTEEKVAQINQSLAGINVKLDSIKESLAIQKRQP